MKRLIDVLWAAIGLGAVGFSSYILIKELNGLDFADVGADLKAITASHWLLVAGSTLCAYSALAWYDQIGLAHLGRQLSWRFVGLVSFTAYALAHNIGFTVFAGALVRYRAYSTKGLTAPEVGLLAAFCSMTFALSCMLLGGIVLLLEPSLVERVPEAPASAGRVLGLVLLAPPWLYAIGSLLHFRPMTIWGFEIIYPRPPIALRQFLAGPVEVIGAAGIIYFALPAADNPGFLIVLGAFIAAFSLALISHAPGGLGVLELTFLNVVPDAPRADVIAALLVFRLFYLVIPLVFSLSMVLLFERQRFGSLLSSSRKP